jgi:hypothetical protein
MKEDRSFAELFLKHMAIQRLLRELSYDGTDFCCNLKVTRHAETGKKQYY